jgi:calcineurin-like phosphoesterase family protein
MNNQKWAITSDWHIGHKNILSFCPRPYKDIESMAWGLANNFNKMVPKDHIGLFAGDMVWKDFDFAREVIASLNCKRKILIVGNHDRGYNAMYSLGFDLVVHNLTLFIGKQKITISHYPLLGLPREDMSKFKNYNGLENWHGEKRNKEWALTNEGQFHIHGHIHSPNGGVSERVQGRQIDAGVDANNYRPILSGEVESWIKKTVKEEEERDNKLYGMQTKML